MASQTELAKPGGGIVEAARELRPLIEKLADQIEEERRLPEELLEPMHAAGMFRMFLPREIGGPELDPWTAFEAIEQLAIADASVAWCAMIAALTSWGAAYVPMDVARLIYDDPRGSVAGSVLGEAKGELAEGGIVVSGRYHYASGCLHCTWITATVPDPRHTGDGPAPPLAAMMPVSDCTIIDNWQTTGLRGTSSNDWTATEVFIPWENTFKWPPPAESSRAAGPLYRFGRLGLPGTSHQAVMLGTARGAIESFVARVDERMRRGVSIKLDADVQTALGKAEALVSAGRAYIKEAVAECWEVVCSGRELNLAERAKLRSAKTMANWNAVEATDLVYEAMGSQAIFGTNPVERRFRDIHATAAHGQSSRKGYTAAGAVLLGVDPGPTPLL